MNRSDISAASAAIKRQAMVRLLPGLLGLITVNEYPKSGASWIGEMLSAASGLPFPRNRAPDLSRAIMHGHYYSPWGLRNVLTVWRDGRDVMVSYYYHCYFYNDRSNARLVRRLRERLPFESYDDIKGNLPAFIEAMLTSPPWPRFTWAQFVERWLDRRGTVQVRYEAMLERSAEELERLLKSLSLPHRSVESIAEIAERHSFARMAGREQGHVAEGRFLRKGIAGDWKNYFTMESAQIFDHYAGDALVASGYEPDRSWVSDIS